MSTNLNNVVYDIIISHQLEVLNENNVRELSTKIVDTLIHILEGDDVVEEFSEDYLLSMESLPTEIIDTESTPEISEIED